MDLKNEKRYTYADYLTWDDDVRYELIDGVPYTMAAPSANHQRVLAKLLMRFGSFLEGKTCEVFPAPFDIRLAADDYDDTVVQPDLVVVCDRSKIDKRGCIGAPDIVIEILSPSSSKRDRYDKLLLYKRAGVREYWIVDIETKTIQVYILKNEEYVVNTYINFDTVPVHVLEGLALGLTDIFAEVDE
jgi:Uma2 family endonuclease